MTARLTKFCILKWDAIFTLDCYLTTIIGITQWDYDMKGRIFLTLLKALLCKITFRNWRYSESKIVVMPCSSLKPHILDISWLTGPDRVGQVANKLQLGNHVIPRD